MSKLVSLIAAASLAGAIGCSKQTTADGPLEQARENQWITTVTDDGGLMVKPKNPQPPKTGDVPYDQRNVSLAVKQAADSVIATDHPNMMRDIRVSIDDQPGVVEIRGNVDTEQEAVNVINAALAVKGVVAVISYLDYPGPEAARVMSER